MHCYREMDNHDFCIYIDINHFDSRKKCTCVHWAFFKFFSPPMCYFTYHRTYFLNIWAKETDETSYKTLQNMKMWGLFVLMLFFWKHVLKVRSIYWFKYIVHKILIELCKLILNEKSISFGIKYLVCKSKKS